MHFLIARRILSVLAACGILGQYYFALERGLGQGKTGLEVTGNFFSYFTILTNLLVVACPRFRSPGTHAALGVYIAVVGVVYHLLLSAQYHLEGWEWVADRILHYVVPPGYLLCWALFAPKEKLPFTIAARWLLFPGLYFAYSLMRGALVGWYPYSFANVNRLGFGPAVQNGLGVLIFFLVLSLIVIGLSRLLHHRQAGRLELGNLAYRRQV
ncbi:MAG: Pr6Pr family membrane protein [Bryobacter sp.]|nr:Pr6Pr family membrane protein [Bryobacter sp.]